MATNTSIGCTSSGRPVPKRKQALGFSLLEMLLVVSIVGFASTLVVLALRDAGQNRLSQLGLQVAASIEKARAQSRAQNTPLWWRTTSTGYAISATAKPANRWNQDKDAVPWPDPDLQSDSEPVLLGPEPVLQPTRIRLWLRSDPAHSVELSTDGLLPFALQSNAP
ncbi:hypothetical protein KIK84_02345 [Curvibacter sp. CHRR-16]|uniref:hypothetical protein n=1 Tax=Curvibacter sp. CHRR-16 TaxID=2835872 RepID=UPI001BD95D55|nr:hypothetical protein [Curvibacter sp. CHRR-16]MBT0569155.1 hypothetical protein [Curvibacter sp. CHRR-16]